MKQLVSTSNTNSCCYFKYPSLGHITCDCPNRKIITLVEEESDGSNKTKAENLSDKDKEVIYAN